MTADSRTQTRALLNRARTQLDPADLNRYVGPCDPGTLKYRVAMSALLQDGEPVLSKSMLINGDLDFDEPISCAQWENPSSYDDSTTFRWYRLMASSAALLLEDRMIEDNENYFLANILSDTFGLKSLEKAPFDLASVICRETRANAPSWAADTKLFCLLGELLMANSDQLNSEEIAVLCEMFETIEQEISFDENYVSNEYCWGTTPFDQLHPTWLALVEEHFPTRGRALFLRTKLLEQGSRWKLD